VICSLFSLEILSNSLLSLVMLKVKHWLGIMAHAYNPSYSEGGDQGSKTAGEKM
jgi:hypothetical protein